jgi:hypothetical protein
VSPALLQRQAALVGAALLAALLVVVLDRTSGEAPATAPPPASGAQWQSAEVGVFGRGRSGATTACGVTLAPDTRGVAHPVFPCGVALVLTAGGREVRTEVIERGPTGSQTQFDVTPALAAELGIDGKQQIRWRFAGQ